MPLEFRLMPPDEWDDRYIPDGNLLGFCGDTKRFFETHTYCSFEKLGFIPVLATDSIKRRSYSWEEHVAVHRKNRYVAVYVYINAREYRDATSFGRIELLYNGIMRAGKMLSEAADFDYKTFRTDYRKFWKENSRRYEFWAPKSKRGPKPKNRKPTVREKIFKTIKEKLPMR